MFKFLVNLVLKFFKVEASKTLVSILESANTVIDDLQKEAQTSAVKAVDATKKALQHQLEAEEMDNLSLKASIIAERINSQLHVSDDQLKEHAKNIAISATNFNSLSNS